MFENGDLTVVLFNLSIGYQLANHNCFTVKPTSPYHMQFFATKMVTSS